MSDYDEDIGAVTLLKDMERESDRESVGEEPFDLRLWKRLEFNQIPIYIRADKPDWFVPNTVGDEILKRWAREGEIDNSVGTLRYLERLPRSPLKRYAGRERYLKTEPLQEVWFRLTTKCNQRCSRCLSQARVEEEESLSAKQVIALANQARALGCRFFVLTGGEPLLHPEFDTIVDALLGIDASHVVILTNGALLREHARAMRNRPRDRVHFQVTAEGGERAFEAMRGAGSYREWRENMSWLKVQDFLFSLSMCVTCDSMGAMTDFIDLAAMCEAKSVHFMWYFAAGEGNVFDLASPDELFDHLLPAWENARKRGVMIDNILAVERQVFSPAGTIFDGTNAGWESVTVGADGKLYPSISLCGFRELSTEIDGDLGRAWRESSVMNRLRRSTVAPFSSCMLLLLGGGDPDHSYLRSGEFAGFDPYWGLYEKIALKLIAERASSEPASGPARLRLKMGDFISHGMPRREVSLRPTKNLFAIVGEKGIGLVSDFYLRAEDEEEEITFNTVSLPEEWVSHIPLENRVRSYGFGSPVHEARLSEGQKVVEIGSDLGVETFIAAKLVGPSGRVVGIEGRDDIRSLAKESAVIVTENLGYRNFEFRKGEPEALPIEDEFADIVVSNCVLNLSMNKRRAIRELYRILKQGGRLVVSDLVCEDEPVFRSAGRNVLCSSCIAGALTIRDLMGLLDEAGFVSPRVLKWLPYRSVGTHTFFRIVFQARKVKLPGKINVMYRGPFASVVTHRGTLMMPGVVRRVSPDEIVGMREEVMVLDEHGAVQTDELL